MGHVQTGFRAGCDSARDWGENSEDQPRQQGVFPIDVFEGLAGAHGGDESDHSHGKEAEGGVAGRQLVHFLGHQDDVVDDVLVAAVAGWRGLLVSLHVGRLGVEGLTKSCDPQTSKVRELPQAQRHQWVRNELLPESKSHQQGNGQHQKDNDEGCAPAIGATAGQHELEENQTRSGEHGADIVHLGLFLASKVVLGKDNRTQDA